MNFSQKRKKFENLIERMVRTELRAALTEAEASTGNEDDSSAAVKKVLKFLESPMFKSRMTSIKNDAHKAELIVRFAALVGIPAAKKQAIMNQIKNLAS